MGTDAGTPFNRPGDNSRELEFMTDLGITPVDALTSSTGNAADLLQLEERGRLRKGHFADLLLVSGNPVEDITAVSNCENHRLVVKNGTPVPR